MKALAPRATAPKLLAGATPKKWYASLRDPKGRIRNRWNGKKMRSAVWSLTHGHCAWCGQILEDGWHVDHYFPKEHSPRLAYCWSNLLPSCNACNTVRKRDYSPPAIEKDTLIDPILGAGTPPERAFEPATLLPTLEERLVDPTFDDPAVHMTFEPENNQYRAKTNVGDTTVRRMFGEKSQHERWRKLGALVLSILRNAPSVAAVDEILAQERELNGSAFYIDAYRAFWTSFGIGPSQ